MVLRQLEYLVALARERHFGRAAAVCRVTQPTLSAALRALEDELGAPLIERGHRFVGLTPEGELALEHAQRMLAAREEMRRGVEELGQGVAGRLRLGVIPTALPFISLVTAPFCARYPRVTVAVLSLSSQEIQRAIDDFEIDVGVTYLDNEPLENIRATPIGHEDYLFLTPSEGPFAQLKAIAWREAAQAQLCLLTPDMQNRRIIDGVFRSVGEAPRPSVETNSIFNLISHVSAGHWSAIVARPLLMCFGVPAHTIAIPLVEPSARRSIGYVVADRDPTPTLVRHLLAMPTPQKVKDLFTQAAPAAR